MALWPEKMSAAALISCSLLKNGNGSNSSLASRRFAPKAGSAKMQGSVVTLVSPACALHSSGHKQNAAPCLAQSNACLKAQYPYTFQASASVVFHS